MNAVESALSRALHSEVASLPLSADALHKIRIRCARPARRGWWARIRALINTPREDTP